LKLEGNVENNVASMQIAEEDGKGASAMTCAECHASILVMFHAISN